MNRKFVDQIKNCSKLSYFDQGDPVYLPYEHSDTLYLIKNGKVELSYTNGRRKLTMVTLGSNELFGEMTLAGETHRELKAEALEDSSIWVIKREDFLKLAAKDPLLLKRVIKLFICRLRKARKKLTKLAFKDLETRLSRLLLKLIRESGEKAREGTETIVNITHREIAELIGSTRASVTNCLSRLEDEGILKKRKYQIIIKNIRGLEHKASQNGRG